MAMVVDSDHWIQWCVLIMYGLHVVVVAGRIGPYPEAKNLKGAPLGRTLFLAPVDKHGNTTIQLDADKPHQTSIKPRHHIKFVLDEILPEVRFIIFQVHTQYEMLSVSSHRNFSSSDTETGSSVGVETLLVPKQSKAVWFVKSHSEKTVNFIATASTYSDQVPVPGACNMEFKVEYDPSLHIDYKKQIAHVTFPMANTGSKRGDDEPNCEQLKAHELHYEVYQYFMRERNLHEEEYFSSVENFLSVDGIETYGTMVKQIKPNVKTTFDVGLYKGQGMVLAVIVRQKSHRGIQASAAYVPLTLYSCNFTSEENSCYSSINIPVQVFTAIVGLSGLFVCFLGHRFFKTELFLFGFYAFTLVSVNTLRLAVTWDDVELLYVSAGLGLLGGIIWLVVWIFVGFPVLSVLLVGFTLGYLVSSILFNATPLGELAAFSTSFNYGISFTCGILLTCVVLLPFPKKLNIISCGVIGAYLTVLAIDTDLHTGFSYILLNSYRKATVPGYVTAVSHAPLQFIDLILYVVWAGLGLIGIIVQFHREKGREDFPPCPYKAYQDRRHQRELLYSTQEGREANETEPLLSPINQSNGAYSSLVQQA